MIGIGHRTSRGFKAVWWTRLPCEMSHILEEWAKHNSLTGASLAISRDRFAVPVAAEFRAGEVDEAWQLLSERAARETLQRPLRVFLHCHGGINRTCLVMGLHRSSFEQAMFHWMRCRMYYEPSINRTIQQHK